MFKRAVKDMNQFMKKIMSMNNKNKLFLLALIILCSLVLHYIFNKTGILTTMLGKLQLMNPMRLMENFSSDDKFVFFAMDGCGHCEAVIDSKEFLKFSSSTDIACIRSHQDRYYTYDGNESEPKEEHNPTIKSMLDGYRKPDTIKGYPTFMLLKNGQDPIVYDGERTETGFKTFLDKHRS